MTKIAVFASGNGTNLQAIIDAVRRGGLAASIELVVCDRPGAYCLTRAREAGIPYFMFYPRKYPSKAAYEELILQQLMEAGVEYIVLAGYMGTIGLTLLNSYPQRIINIHHAFLPAFMGGNPYRRAWERGVKMIGATAHYATADLDEGPIIEQDVERITHESSPDDLRQRGRDIERRVLTRAVRAHLEHRVIISGHRTIVFSK